MGKHSWNVTGIVLPQQFTDEQIKYWKSHKTFWQKDYEESLARRVREVVDGLIANGTKWELVWEEAYGILTREGRAPWLKTTFKSKHEVKRIYYPPKQRKSHSRK